MFWWWWWYEICCIYIIYGQCNVFQIYSIRQVIHRKLLWNNGACVKDCVICTRTEKWRMFKCMCAQLWFKIVLVELCALRDNTCVSVYERYSEDFSRFIQFYARSWTNTQRIWRYISFVPCINDTSSVYKHRKIVIYVGNERCIHV